MQDSLFDDQDDAPERVPDAPRTRAGKGVQAAPADAAHLALARSLPTRLRMGTSSWTFPGWTFWIRFSRG